MQYVTDLMSLQMEGDSAVTLGKFDSLHRGHQKLIHKVQEYAADSITSIVFAFDMQRESLLTKEEKRMHLENETDILISCPFTKEIREMSAEDFIEHILVQRLHAKYIVVGTDFHFGYQQRGDVEMLADYADKYGYHLDVVEKECHKDMIISSTAIREALQEGNISLVNELLGYTYQMYGIVEHGNRIGRKLGFPTMNVAPRDNKMMPKHGVYTCRVEVDGVWYNGIGNVGVKPTVEEEPVVLAEVYVFDFEGDAYDKEIKIQFCEFERPEQKFGSLDELKAQLQKDILFGREYFGMNKKEDHEK